MRTRTLRHAFVAAGILAVALGLGACGSTNYFGYAAIQWTPNQPVDQAKNGGADTFRVHVAFKAAGDSGGFLNQPEAVTVNPTTGAVLNSDGLRTTLDSISPSRFYLNVVGVPNAWHGLPNPGPGTAPCEANGTLAVRPDPGYLDRWGRAVRELAQAIDSRYGAKFVGIEVWNEPNYDAFWGRTPSPAAYTNLLSATWNSVHPVLNRLVISTGGLSPGVHCDFNDVYADQWPLAGGTGKPGYLHQMMVNGAGNYANALAYHPYPKGNNSIRSPDEIAQRIGDETADAWNEWVNHGGRTSDQLWITEVGVSSCSGSPACVGGGPVQRERAQCEALVSAYTRSVGIWDVASVYTLRDSVDNPVDWLSGLGVQRPNGTPKPAYGALLALRQGQTPNCSP